MNDKDSSYGEGKNKVIWVNGLMAAFGLGTMAGILIAMIIFSRI